MNLRTLGVAAVTVALLSGLVPATAQADPSPSLPVTSTPTEAATPPITPASEPPATPVSTPPTTPATTPTQTPTVVPSAPPRTAAAEPLSISLDQPATSWEDRPMTFTGKVSSGAVGWYISLWQALPSGWTLRSSTKTTTGGAYRMTYTPTTPIHTTFRAVIGPKFYGAPAISPARIGTAQDRKLVINPPAASYITLTGVAVYGHTTPAQPGLEVVLQDLLGNGTWRWLTSVKVDANGYFHMPIPDNFPHTRTVRVVSRGVAATAVEVSASARFVIKAAPNPKVFAVAASMVPKTYRSGCPVAPSSLRLLILNYWGFDGLVHKGELILRDAAVQKMISVWTASFNAHFPIRRMQRVDVFGGNDVTSMAADNTSAFNCRQVTGDPYSLSPHSYGFAIDINTVENPYLAANNVWYPSNGLSYRNRSAVRPGMLFSSSTTTRSLIGQGYFWGANWSKPDYQHFEPK
jgi:D-alanyl-D-alanine carboxypeptidase-like protein